jgi:hypothetical protein
MEDQRENNAINKTTGSPSTGSPGTKPVVRGIEDIWKANAGSPPIYPERRRNGTTTTGIAHCRIEQRR